MMKLPLIVIPAQAGIHSYKSASLDSRLRGNDDCRLFSSDC